MSRSGLIGYLGLLCMWPGTGLRGEERPVALRTEATVQRGTIQLSDLLPSNVTAMMRLTAEKISLGKAPEPGSFRIFSAEGLRSTVGGAMAVKFPALAVVHSAGWPLRDASIRRALRESEAGRRYDFSQAELIPPADFSTGSADPQLEVLAIRPGKDARRRSADLRCQQRADCSHFLVEIVFGEPVPAVSAARLHPGKSGEGKSGAANSGGASHAAVVAGKVALVQPGRPAALWFEGAGFKITTRVFPLQRAVLGQTVRVFDPAARHVSLARVEGKDLMSFREAR